MDIFLYYNLPLVQVYASEHMRVHIILCILFHYCGMCVVCSVRTYVCMFLLSAAAATATLCVCGVSPGASGHWCEESLFLSTPHCRLA